MLQYLLHGFPGRTLQLPSLEQEKGVHSLRGLILAFSDIHDQAVTIPCFYRFIRIVLHQAGRRVWSFGQVRHLSAVGQLWGPHQLACSSSVHYTSIIGTFNIKDTLWYLLQVSTKQRQLESLHLQAS
jgi:hypothetical protein